MNQTNLIEDWTLLPPPPWWQNPLVWAGLVLAAAAVWWLRRWWKGRTRRPVPVPRPAPAASPPLHTAFLARLAALRNRREQISAYELAIEVSEILRGYLEVRFQFHILFQTTREFLEAVADSPALNASQRAHLETFLRSCDAVKFAQRPATPEEQVGLLDAAEALIRQAAGMESIPPAGMNDLRQLEFLHPWVLLGLGILPVLAWWLGRRGPVPTLSVPTLQGLSRLGRAPRRHPLAWRWLGLILPLACLIVALARPRVPRGDTPDPSRGIDIMLCLDFSRSMAEEDFRLQGRRVSRRRALEEVTTRFIQGRPADRIGIVCFARSPFLVSPLTLDHNWAIQSLRETDLATGTGIGWALMASVNFLKRDSDRSKVVILVTDGENSVGPRPLDVISLASQAGIKVYSILIGPEVVTPSAAAGHELNRASRSTGGQFFQATDARALERIYQLIDQLEKRELIQKRYVLWRELYPAPLWTGLGLWVVTLLWTRLIRRRTP